MELKYFQSESLSLSSSKERLSELMQPDPLQFPRAGVHFTLCFQHVHLSLHSSISLPSRFPSPILSDRLHTSFPFLYLEVEIFPSISR